MITIANINSKRLLRTARRLDGYVNVPYFPATIVQGLRELLPETLTIAEDEYAVYVRYGRGDVAQTLIIDTHLDHPGFVASGNAARAIGSIGSVALLDKINTHPYVPVHFVMGDAMISGTLSQFTFADGALTAKTDKPMPPNTPVMLSLSSHFDETFLWMRSADNLAVTAAALELLYWLCDVQPDGNVIVIFTKLEEVRQVSATLIARRGGTPFGAFRQEDIFVCLEAATIGQTPETARIQPIAPTLDGGVVVRVSDNELRYSLPTMPNRAEWLALHAAERSGGDWQHAPLISNCDATPYVLFGQSPVIGLTVPCLHKHNVSERGVFVLERVRRGDLLTVTAILQNMVLLSQREISPHPRAMLHAQPPTTPENLMRKRRQWARTATWASPRLAAGHLQAETLGERIGFGWGSLMARWVR